MDYIGHNKHCNLQNNEFVAKAYSFMSRRFNNQIEEFFRFIAARQNNFRSADGVCVSE